MKEEESRGKGGISRFTNVCCAGATATVSEDGRKHSGHREVEEGAAEQGMRLIGWQRLRGDFLAGAACSRPCVSCVRG